MAERLERYNTPTAEWIPVASVTRDVVIAGSSELYIDIIDSGDTLDVYIVPDNSPRYFTTIEAL